MKKNGFILGMAAIVLTGCLSSYRGSADYTVPLSEQATLIISFGLRATEFDYEYVNWGNGDGKIGGDLYVNIPKGEHTFTFNYLAVSEYSSGGYTYTTTSSASDLAAEAKFEAGNTYRAYIQYLSGNKARVKIDCIKEGKAKNFFAGPETQVSMDIGGISTSTLGLHAGMKIGMVFDNVTRTAWNIETGFGAGFFPTGFDLFFGGNYEVYFNRKGIGGVSVGGGLVWPLGQLYPYARIGIPFVLGGMKLSLYGTYYFTDFILAETDSPLFEKDNLKQFCLGVNFSM